MYVCMIVYCVCTGMCVYIYILLLFILYIVLLVCFLQRFSYVFCLFVLFAYFLAYFLRPRQQAHERLQAQRLKKQIILDCCAS